jgi:spore coat polysaccharide biosynthesis protein SpsF
MSDNRTVAIVQARMGSRRYPGKMMEVLESAPLIEWVLRRTCRATLLDSVVLATTTHERDNPLVDVAECLGIDVYRGSEEDVLDRYARAAEISEAQTVVRICADRPLVDPDVIDMAIRTYIDHKPDLAFNHISEGIDRWPRGLGAEVFSAELLAWMDQHTTDREHREHVTLYAWTHRNRFHILAAPCPPALDPGVPDVKLDVDEPADLQLLRKLCSGEGPDVPPERIVARWRELKAA